MRKPRPPRVTPISITIRCGALQRRLRDVSQLHLRATRPPPFDHYDEAHRADVGDCPLSGVKRTSNARIEFFRLLPNAPQYFDRKKPRGQTQPVDAGKPWSRATR